MNPGEFKELTNWIGKKENEPLIDNELKPLWEANLQNNAGLPNPNSGLLQRIKVSIFEQQINRAQPKMQLYSYGLKIAAVLVIGLLITTVYFFRTAEEYKSSIQVQTITTPFGAKTSTVLPDGSLVWLNSGSTLSFPSGFVKNRPVTLTGEAYFEVAKSNKPFIVITPYGEVEVQGTSFNVKAYSDDNSFEATLVKGKVLVRDKNNINGVTLWPGQQAVRKSNGLKVINVETTVFTSWKEGKLIFRKDYLTEVARRLERWYNVKIELDNDKRLADIWYAGTIEMESFSEVLELLQVTAPITFSFNDKTRTIKIMYKKN